MGPMFKRAGAELPERFRVTLSLTRKSKVVGLCYPSDASGDQTFEILVRIDQDDPAMVAAILAHELTHAAVGLEHGHKGEFKRVARALGFKGKLTQCDPGEDFLEEVAPILAKAGPFPHAALNYDHSSGPKKQGTRLIKVQCDSCEFVVRQTRKWLDEVGPAHCPHHGAMKPEDLEDAA
jgi:hypothetical protein